MVITETYPRKSVGHSNPLLVAEDETDARQAIVDVLHPLGYETVPVGDGLDAWERYLRGDIRLILSDWEMPGLPGPELCRHVRLADERKGFGYTYVMLVTCRADGESVVRGMQAGADDLITKPFRIEDMRIRLAAAERILKMQQRVAEMQPGTAPTMLWPGTLHRQAN